jgi:hypothetical protein
MAHPQVAAMQPAALKGLFAIGICHDFLHICSAARLGSILWHFGYAETSSRLPAQLARAAHCARPGDPCHQLGPEMVKYTLSLVGYTNTPGLCHRSTTPYVSSVPTVIDLLSKVDATKAAVRDAIYIVQDNNPSLSSTEEAPIP